MFPGQYEDSETGLYYNWHRYYSPELGRYITSDPIGLSDGPSTYGYAQQNPIGNVDSTGLNSVVATCRADPVFCASIGLLGAGAVYHGVKNSPSLGSCDAVFSTSGSDGSGSNPLLDAALITGSPDPNNDDWFPPEMKGTQKGKLNSNTVDKYKGDMLNGRFNYRKVDNIIGGYRDANGVFHVTEGHHRIAAAREILRQTGNSGPLRSLLNNGRWTNVRNAPVGSRPLPSRLMFERFRNWLGF